MNIDQWNRKSKQYLLTQSPQHDAASLQQPSLASLQLAQRLVEVEEVEQ